jgi:hypothetical protein
VSICEEKQKDMSLKKYWYNLSDGRFHRFLSLISIKIKQAGTLCCNLQH